MVLHNGLWTVLFYYHSTDSKSHFQHDGVTDRNKPLAHWGLGVANDPCSATLYPDRIAAGVNGPQGTSNIAHLGTIISSIIGRAPTNNAPVLHMPPKPSIQPVAVISPVIPTPSKLLWFLDHPVANLGIATACNFESPMR